MGLRLIESSCSSSLDPGCRRWSWMRTHPSQPSNRPFVPSCCGFSIVTDMRVVQGAVRATSCSPPCFLCSSSPPPRRWTGTAVRMMRECSRSALAAQCQAVPLPLQLQFAAIIAPHPGCGGGAAGAAQGDKTQSPASCFCARVANVPARLCSCVHVVLCGSSLLLFSMVVVT